MTTTDPLYAPQDLLKQGDAALEAGDLAQAEYAYMRALSANDANLDPSERCDALNRVARIFFIKGVSEKAIEYLEQATSLRPLLTGTTQHAKTLINLGNVWLSKYDHQKALSLYLEAEGLLPYASEDTAIYSANLLNIANIYIELGDYQSAIMYSLRANATSSSGDYVATAAHLNLGHAYLKTGQLAEAERHLNVALDILKASPDASLEAGVLDSLAQLQELRGDWASALGLHRQLLGVVRAIGDAEGQLDALSGIGRITAERLEAAEALAPLHEALELAVRVQRPKSQRDVHQVLSGAYKRLGRLDLALEHFERYHAIERELFNEDRERTVRTLTAQFEVERARQEAQAEGQRRQDAEEAQARAEALVRERTADLEQAQHEIVSRLALAAEFRDDTTGEHTWRVGQWAGLIAAELGLPRGQVELLRVAARLHDVGKIGIPDAILLKAGRLSPQEFQEMKSHTLIGARLLAGGRSELLRLAECIALTHHERWDGTGYPHGLAGEAIPLVGRIVAVADVFDALTQRRPYKNAWSQEEALAELCAHSGKQFDPAVVEAALRVFSRAELRDARPA